MSAPRGGFVGGIYNGLASNLAFAQDGKIYRYSRTNTAVSLFTGSFMDVAASNGDGGFFMVFANPSDGPGASLAVPYGAITLLGSTYIPDMYVKNGVLSGGVYKGKFYDRNGILGNGVVDGKYYRNGVLASFVTTALNGTTILTNGTTYKKGIPFKGLLPYDNQSGEFFLSWLPVVVGGGADLGYVTENPNLEMSEDTYLINGVPAAGVVSGFQFGNDGKIVSGGLHNGRYFINGLPASGIFNNVVYKNGTRFTGSNVIWSDVSAGDAGTLAGMFPGLSINAIQANCIFNWPNSQFTGQQVTDTFGGEPPLNAYFFNGVLAHGVVNGKVYSNGIQQTGDAIVSNVLYKNGAAFAGTLKAPSNRQVTFASTTLTLPSSGTVTFAAGLVAHGFVGGKFFDKGIPVTSTGTYSLYLSAGTIANGTMGGVTYRNGIVMY
jgi:hypothetical protein